MHLTTPTILTYALVLYRSKNHNIHNSLKVFVSTMEYIVQKTTFSKGKICNILDLCPLPNPVLRTPLIPLVRVALLLLSNRRKWLLYFWDPSHIILKCIQWSSGCIPFAKSRRIRSKLLSSFLLSSDSNINGLQHCLHLLLFCHSILLFYSVL